VSLWAPRLALLVGIAVAAAGVPAAWAAAAGDHHAPSIADLLFPVLNFSLFAAILYRFAWPVVKVAIAERRRSIEAEIGEADQAEREAREALAEVEKRRAQEHDERERLLGQLRQEGERERTLLAESARRSAQRLREDARRLGEDEAARAVLEIRRAVVAEAARRAEETLRQRLGDAEQGRFVGEFLSGIEAEAPR
jgi:F-type H+-transporting ATPase subunit b